MIGNLQDPIVWKKKSNKYSTFWDPIETFGLLDYEETVNQKYRVFKFSAVNTESTATTATFALNDLGSLMYEASPGQDCIF